MDIRQYTIDLKNETFEEMAKRENWTTCGGKWEDENDYSTESLKEKARIGMITTKELKRLKKLMKGGN